MLQVLVAIALFSIYAAIVLFIMSICYGSKKKVKAYVPKGITPIEWDALQTICNDQVCRYKKPSILRYKETTFMPVYVDQHEIMVAEKQ
jgi:hypothetical protein